MPQLGPRETQKAINLSKKRSEVESFLYTGEFSTLVCERLEKVFR